MSDGRYVRVKTGSELVICIVCGRKTAHDLVVSGLGGRLRRSVPRSDLRHYSLCRVCGTKIPHTGETSAAAVPAEQTSSGTPASLGPTDGG
ncbi:MAG: hypothetical protein QOC98_528 [Frankiaceae bacterium]|nr:hypothetical protein [Frankiaceae bacterium]